MRVLEEMRVLDDRLIGDTQAGEKRKQDWQMVEKQEGVGAAQSGLSGVAKARLADGRKAGVLTR